ncbi:hypothetical protein [Bacillus wiedmannii]|uniref:hypothetical protein n=1 Tax=Bacillus wiedmannii TaxID=1890302 RepID=UPI0034677A94
MAKVEAIWQNMTEAEKQAVVAINEFKDEWKAMEDAMTPTTLRVMAEGRDWLRLVMKPLFPVFQATGESFANMFAYMDNAIETGRVNPFFKHMNTFAVPMFERVMLSAGNILKGFGGLMVAYKKLNDAIDICVKYKNYHDDMIDKFRCSTKVEFEMNEVEFTAEKLEKTTLEKVYTMFLEKYEDEEMEERIVALKLNRHHLQNEHYVGLLTFQKKYITPLLIEHQIEETDGTGALKSVMKESIVRNYQILIKELFGRLSKLLWSSTYDAKHQEFNNRVATELTPYLGSLEGIPLMNETKRDFEAQISYYFGAPKKSERLASFTNINKFIEEHGFKVNRIRKTIDKEKTTIWTIERT